MKQSRTLMSRLAAANYMGTKPNAPTVWAASRCYDPSYVKVGRRVMYRTSDVETFIADNVKGADHV